MAPLQLVLPVALLACATAPACAAGEQLAATCFASAAERNQLDEDLLLAIAKVESDFNPRAMHYDSDGTYDLGVMQINSSHLTWLQARNITVDTLLGRPCVNVAIGAEILAGFVRQFGATWRAVGAYGAGIQPAKEQARRSYAALVAGALVAIRKSRDRRDLVAASFRGAPAEGRRGVHMLVAP
jgi:soluble lytic murein transglycosylase-like protein